MSLLWKRIPRRVFGGRVRSSTLLMCLLWIALATLNSYLNPPPAQQTGGSAPAVTVPDEPAEPMPARTSVQPSVTVTPSPTVTGPTPEPGQSSGSATPTTSPMIVLPPGLVPPGVELPPGVGVATSPSTATPSATTPPAAVTPTSPAPTP